MADSDTAAADFSADLNASLAGATPGEYVQQMQQLIEQLDAFKSPSAPTNEAEYRQVWAIKSALCGLSCFTFNNKHPRDREVWELESVYGTLMYEYNRRLLITDAIEKQVANYVLQERHYVTHDEAAFRALLRYLAQRDRLRSDPDAGLCVIGLYKKVGDNVFSISGNRRHHRRYLDTTGRQAFPVGNHFQNLAQREFASNVPAIDDTYRVTFLGDAKGRARYPKLTRNTFNVLQQALRGAPPKTKGSTAQQALL
jgi:hypothetical protein